MKILSDEKWENIEEGKILRDERRKYSGRRGGGNTQGGKEEEKYSGRRGGGRRCHR